MKLLLRWLVCALVVLAVSVTYAQDETPEATPEATAETTPEAFAFPGTGPFTVQASDGTFDRQYRIYIPEAYDAAAPPVPLLMALHGAGGSGAQMADLTQFNALADEFGFIALYPDGYNRIWNDGRPADSRVGPVDDVAYLSGVIDSLSGVLNIDPAKVYVTGYSAGGMMAYRMGCDLPDQIAAVAPVATSFPEYLVNSCEGTPPVPTLMIQGTDDPVIPWLGYQGGYLSAGESLAYWGDHNDCAESTAPTPQDDLDPDDGTLIIYEARSACAEDADVLLYGVYHGGHTWPGRAIDAPFELGLTSAEINASQLIWAFFSGLDA